MKRKEAEYRIKEIISRSEDIQNVYTPFELCEKMLDKLPMLNTKINVLILFNLEFLYTIRERIEDLSNVWFVTSSDLKIQAAKNIGILENHIIKYEYNIKELNKIKENMPKFDVVVGNPPYQLGKDKLFYMKFIKLAYEISNKHVLFITPAAIFTTNVKFYEDKKNEFEYINLDPKTHKYFKVGLGTLFSYYVIDKNKNDFEVTVNFGDNEQQLNLKKLKYNILDKRNYDPIFDSIMSKYYLKGIKKRFKGKGDLINKIEDTRHIFKKEKSKDFQYPAYLSSKHDRKNVFSRKPGEGYGIPKLVVTDIMEPNRAERFSEFNKDKSVGRYSNYFKVKNEKEAKNIQNFFNSDLYKFLDKKNRSGRYAFLNIPDIDYSKLWNDKELYNYYNFTPKEIDYIESQIK